MVAAHFIRLVHFATERLGVHMIRHRQRHVNFSECYSSHFQRVLAPPPLCERVAFLSQGFF